jgi:hypothetical protein
MAATGMAEFLLNKSLGIRSPKLGGPTDLSEQWTLALSRGHSVGNNYTDAVDLLVEGGYVRDSRLRFKAYGDASWINEALPAVDDGSVRRTMPEIRKEVLFNAGGEGSQRQNGIMHPGDLEKIKMFLRDEKSPVLFVYQPPGVDWWHANIITGYDDARQVFIMRDSAFGAKRTDIPAYGYDGHSPWGPQPYRGEFEMGYRDAMAWGNHATGYTLVQPADAKEPAERGMSLAE